MRLIKIVFVALVAIVSCTEKKENPTPSADTPSFCQPKERYFIHGKSIRYKDTAVFKYNNAQKLVAIHSKGIDSSNSDGVSRTYGRDTTIYNQEGLLVNISRKSYIGPISSNLLSLRHEYDDKLKYKQDKKVIEATTLYKAYNTRTGTLQFSRNNKILFGYDQANRIAYSSVVSFQNSGPQILRVDSAVYIYSGNSEDIDSMLMFRKENNQIEYLTKIKFKVRNKVLVSSIPYIGSFNIEPEIKEYQVNSQFKEYLDKSVFNNGNLVSTNLSSISLPSFQFEYLHPYVYLGFDGLVNNTNVKTFFTTAGCLDSTFYEDQYYIRKVKYKY